MPRSTIRSPRKEINLSKHLMELRDSVAPDPSAGFVQRDADFVDVPEIVTSETLFGNDRPLEIEVGSGKGLFLTNESARNEDFNFLGIEIIHKYAKHAASKLVKAGRDNAKMVSGNAEPIFSKRIPPGSLEAVHVYFPDPWWKKRHRKRRVVNEQSIQNFLKALRPGGRFHFWTDVLDYFEDTIEMIAEVAPQFGVPIPEEKAESTHDLDYRTHFERRSRQNNIPVYRVRYEKRSQPS